MSRRTERVAEAIREVAAMAILFELHDPRVSGVTVTKAEVTGDLRHAKIFVSLSGDEKTQRLTLAGLKSARGFLQRKIAGRLETRYTPVVDIVVDESIKKSLEIARVLKEVLPAPPTQGIESTEPADDESVTSLEEGS